MRARVKQDSRVLSVTAFGGVQYSLVEWILVPPGCEAEALRHPYLEVEQGQEPAVETEPAVTDEIPATPKPVIAAPAKAGKGKGVKP